ncbi:MAG: RNA methyltransferase [Betaproteobacteria bacterium]|nr:RNA methyltransferase [Betaproteobacteria bacterium]
MTKPGVLENVRIVLSHTSHPGNIGAAARAMKTMGLSSLYLVRPKHFPDAQADAMASGAQDVLARARVCGSLPEALQGVVLAAAVSARRRELAQPAVDAREGAAQLLAQSGAHPVAVVFGTEMSGLSNADVGLCQLLVHIPANPAYSSLNLAAAVQILAYELRLAGGLDGVLADPSAAAPLAPFEDVERFYAYLEEVLVGVEFLNPLAPKRLMERLRRLFARARLEREEVNILRGILTAVQKSREK